MDDNRSICTEAPAKDWVSDTRAFFLLWGLPIGAIIVASFTGPLPRVIVWTVALLWMGTACLANARRCRRTHCIFTGPFLILMAGTVVTYSFGILPLGASGWNIISGVSLVGSALLWWGSERVFDAYWLKTAASQ